MLLQQLINETALDSLPATSKYKLHPRRLQEWLGKHGMAISLLGDSAVTKPLDARRMAQMRHLFPELSEDPFWRICQSVMMTSPEAVAAKENVPLIAAQLRAIEAFDTEHPRTMRDLLNATVLQRVFYLRDRTIKIVIEHCERAYRQLHLDYGFVSDALAKRTLLRAVVTAPEVRAFWRERMFADEDVQALLPMSTENAGSAPVGTRVEEMLKRAMMRALERQVALQYTGQTWDEVVAGEPALAALHERRAFGREAGETLDLGAYFADALAARPSDLLDWLERSYAQPDSFASRILPEFCTSSTDDHGTSDHGEPLDVLAYRLGLDKMSAMDLVADFEGIRDRSSNRAGEPR